MTRIICSLEHPIVFIFDYDCDEVEIPEYDESEVVSSNELCISVRAISDVDGDVQIGLNDSPLTIDMIEAFVGMIGTPNKKLSVVNSNNDKLLETQVVSDKTRVKVLVNHADFPERIEIYTLEE